MKILIVSFLALVSTSCSETTTPHTQVQEAETSNLTPSYAYSGLHPAYQPSTHQPQPAYQPSPSYVGVGVGAANQYQDPYYQAGYGTYYQHSTPKYTETSQESGLVRTMATVLSAVRVSCYFLSFFDFLIDVYNWWHDEDLFYNNFMIDMVAKLL